MSVTASLDSAIAEPIRLAVPNSGLVARDFLVAEPKPVAIRGHVTGTNGGPIPRAHVAVLGGAESTADENGVFTVVAARAGTQTLFTRAIGYFPDERAIDVIPGNGQWIEVQLPTAASVLDTVHVLGKRIRDVDATGFDRRRAGGIGVFLTADDVQAAHAETVTQLLRQSKSLWVARMSNGHLGVSARGGPCLPSVYVDGEPFSLVEDVSEIDLLVDIGSVEKMEIYAGGETPAEFEHRGGCADIVIWTRH